MRQMRKILILWLLLGMAYYTLEGVWAIPKDGQASIIMLLIGGLCGVLVGGINQVPRFYRLKVVWQALIGAGIVTAVEFAAGCIINLWLGLHIWDYTKLPCNVLGQICLPFTALWVLLMPFAIWAEDAIRWALWREGKPYSPLDIYVEFITFK